MTEKKFNFDLGSRSLTANESRAVETAKGAFRASLERHLGQTVAGHAVFKATSNATGAGMGSRPRGTDVVNGNAPLPPRGTDAVGKGTASWKTKKVASAGRKY